MRYDPARLPPGGSGRRTAARYRLLVPPGNAPSFAKSQDVNMLVNLGGRERSEAEYGALLRAAGFTLSRAIPAQGELHVIEGIPT